MDAILKNWKTTAAGVAVMAVATAFLLGRITLEQFLGAFAVLTAGGLVASRDAKTDKNDKPV